MIPLTTETARTRWLAMLGTWFVCGLLIALHAVAVRDYMATLDVLGRRGGEAPATPLRQFVPARYADAQMWVRHTLTAREKGVARVRFTDTDNAPLGRDVHWASGFRWLVDAGGRIRAAVTGEAPVAALEGALVWINVPLLLVLMIAISGWAAQRAGAGVGVLVAAGMVALPRFYENFAPMNADHHGLIAAAVFGLLLGIVFMGAGWWQPEGGSRAPFLPSTIRHARAAAVFSAICGAVGLWISAASTIPAIAMSGVGGLIAAWFFGRTSQAGGTQFAPELWRLWGGVGAGLSIFFYLVEYAPAHLGLRLEVNHPFYAMAWWGGAELVAIVGSWRLGHVVPRASFAWRSALALAAVLAPLAVMAAGGTTVFALRDPFVSDLRHFVIEGQTLATVMRRIGFSPLAGDFALGAVTLAAAFLLFRLRGAARIILTFLAVVTVTWTLLTIAEIRWLMTLSAAHLMLIVFLAALALQGRTARRQVALITASVVTVLAIGVTRVVAEHKKIETHWLAEDDGLQLVFRDAAALLRASQPEGDIVVLASPNASMSLGYFGQFKSLGTLFWENTGGLKAAAEIFSARTDEEAATLIRARGVTHIVIVSNALFLEEYFRLLRPDEPPANAQQTFGFRLLLQPAQAPRWLQPLPYRWRVEFEPFAKVVLLFKVAFDQTEPERHYHTALAQLARDDVANAEKSIQLAFDTTPTAQRATLCEAAGAAFYEYGADAAAVRLFRRALEFDYDPGIATTVAWILASTANVSLRDGRGALALLEPQLHAPPADATFFSALAAAQAEVGRFSEATIAAQRALELATASGDKAAVPSLQKRLEAYRANRPWRK